jgi:hypothetical protein
VKTIVYVEGGGRQRKTLDDCRRGFGRLFEKFVIEGDTPKVIACGDRRSTFRDFQGGINQGKEGFLILLVDSEAPVEATVTPWAHLRARDGWRQPAQAVNDQAHLMVQCMESWFVADRQAVADYYGQRFRITALPGHANVEEIPKRDIQQGLNHATARTQKGRYHKTRHGFELLALVDPVQVRRASEHARKLFEMLERKARS